MDKDTTPVYVYPNRTRISKIKQEKVDNSSTSILKKNNKSIDEIDLTVNNNPLKKQKQSSLPIPEPTQFKYKKLPSTVSKARVPKSSVALSFNNSDVKNTSYYDRKRISISKNSSPYKTVLHNYNSTLKGKEMIPIPEQCFCSTVNGPALHATILERGKNDDKGCFTVEFDSSIIPNMKVKENMVPFLIEAYNKTNDHEITSSQESSIETPKNIVIFENIDDIKDVSTTTLSGINWEYKAELSAPKDIHSGNTTIKEEYNESMVFSTPISSLLAFLPIGYWKQLVKQSNSYAHVELNNPDNPHRTISGHKWTKDITLQEMMLFHGILLWMVIIKLPGRSYADAWNHPAYTSFTHKMKLHRFRQIRSVLHIQEIHNKNQKNDTLYKIRPLFDTLKVTLPKYANIGDNLVIDEGSYANKGRYAAHILCYNPQKPCGKYHFRVYLLCCSVTYIILSFKFHTRNNSDYSNPKEAFTEKQGTNDTDDIHDDPSILSGVDCETTPPDDVNKISELVLELAKPYIGSKRIINMDNYYGSPHVLMCLKNNGLYGRCTTRTDRKYLPNTILFKKTDSKKFGRGALRYASEKQYQMAAFGWLDGNPVHLLSTADGTITSDVVRRIGKESKRVLAPDAVKNYNSNMDAVDRFDQLLSTFSLSSHHTFHKYYRSLMMVCLDFALVQADIHYHMVHPHLKKNNRYRVEFFESIANSMIGKDWSQHTSNSDEITAYEGDIERMFEENYFNLEFQNSYFKTNDKYKLSLNVCSPISISEMVEVKTKDGKTCQICRFEGRGTKTKNVNVCSIHGVRCCTVTHQDHTSGNIWYGRSKSDNKHCDNWDWLCPDKHLTCWEKFHTFYLGKELFTSSGFYPSIRTSNSLYKQRNTALNIVSTYNKRKNKNIQLMNNNEDISIITGFKHSDYELLGIPLDRQSNEKSNNDNVFHDNKSIQSNGIVSNADMCNIKIENTSEYEVNKDNQHNNNVSVGSLCNIKTEKM